MTIRRQLIVVCEYVRGLPNGVDAAEGGILSKNAGASYRFELRERAMSRCGKLSDLQAGVSSPLEVSRFDCEPEEHSLSTQRGYPSRRGDVSISEVEFEYRTEST